MDAKLSFLALKAKRQAKASQSSESIESNASSTANTETEIEKVVEKEVQVTVVQVAAAENNPEQVQDTPVDPGEDSMETRAHILENEMRNMRSKLNEVKKSSTSKDSEIALLKVKLSRSTNESDRVKSASEAIVKELESLKQSNEDQAAVITKLNAKLRESEATSASAESLRVELSELQLEMKSILEQTHSSQSEESKYRILTMQFEKERAELKSRLDWSNNEMARQGSEYETYRAEKESQVRELTKSVETLTHEKQNLESKAAALNEKSLANDTRIDQLVKKIAESDTCLISCEESFKSELNMHQSLANLYKSKSEEATSQLESLRQSLHISDAECDKAMAAKTSLESSISLLKRELEVKDDAIESLEARVATLTEETSRKQSVLNPASVQLDMGAGKTFTEIYSEFSEVKEENLQLKAEVFKLNESLNLIITDINERAPIIKQIVADKRILSSEVKHLKGEIAKREADLKINRDENENLKKEVSRLESRNRSLLQEAKDSGNQVQHLLLRLENAGAASETESANAENASLFSSISELQSQNTQLRASLRSMTESFEELKAQHAALSKTKTATVELEDLRTQMQEVSEKLRISDLKAGSYKRERDQIKWLLDNQNQKAPAPVAAAETIAPIPSDANSANFEAMFKQLQIEFDEFRNETGTDTQHLKTSHAELTKAKADLEMQVVKVNSALNNLQERYKSVSEHSAFQKSEKKELFSRITSLLHTQTLHETRLQDATATLVTLRSQIETLNAEKRRLEAEKDVLARSEARLVSEKQELVAQREMGLSHLKRLQQLFEESEGRIREANLNTQQSAVKFEARIENLNAQLLEAKEAASSAVLTHESKVGELQIKIVSLTSQLETSAAESAALKAAEIELKQAVESLKLQLSAAIPLTESSTGAAETSVASLTTELSNVRSQLATAHALSHSQKEQIEQYKAIAKASEEKLLQKNEEFESRFSLYRVEMDQKLQDLNASNAAVERARLDAESRSSKALEELSEQRTLIDKDHIEFLMDKSRLEDELERLKKSEESARNSCIHLGNEVSKYKQSLADSRSDYENVIVLESERIKTMEDLRRALEAAKSEVSAIQEKMHVQEAAKTSQIQSLQATITRLEEEVRALKDIDQNLRSENASLQSQLDTVSDRLGSMHSRGQSNLASNEENHAATIRNLRREKEILEQEHSLATQKTNRIQLQMQNLQRSLDDARTALNQERQKGETTSDSERLHRELMSKIDRVNVLNESNATLRSQNTSLSRKIEHLESLIKVKEADLGPLRDRNAAIHAENEALKARMETLLEENGRLVNRASQILGKYSRVDPAEHQSLKDQLAALSDKFGSSQALFDAEKKTLDDSKRALEERIATVTSELASTKAALAKLSLEHSKLQANAADKSIEAALREEVENEKAKYKDTVARSNERMKKMIDRLKDSQAKNKELEDGLKTMETRLNDSAILQKAANDLVAMPKPGVLSPVTTQLPRSEIVSNVEIAPETLPVLMQPPQADSVASSENIAGTPKPVELLPKSDSSSAMDVTSADEGSVLNATNTQKSNETPSALTNVVEISSEPSSSHQAHVMHSDAVIADGAQDLSGGLPKRSREEEPMNSIESELVANAAIEELDSGSQSKRQKTEEVEDGELHDEPISTEHTFEIADAFMQEPTQLDQSDVNLDSLVEDSGQQQPVASALLEELPLNGTSNDSSAPTSAGEPAVALILDPTVELSTQTIVHPTDVSQQENAKTSAQELVADASIASGNAITMPLLTPDISSLSGAGITEISPKFMTEVPSASPTVNTLATPGDKLAPAPNAQPALAVLPPAAVDIAKPAGPSAEDKTNLLKQKLKLMAMKKTNASNIASSPSGGSPTSEPTASGSPAAVAIPSNATTHQLPATPTAIRKPVRPTGTPRPIVSPAAVTVNTTPQQNTGAARMLAQQGMSVRGSGRGRPVPITLPGQQLLVRPAPPNQSAGRGRGRGQVRPPQPQVQSPTQRVMRPNQDKPS